jgi:hypothetical protein
MIVWKSVKPTKMKDDVFRLEFLYAVHKAEREIKKDFQETVKTWDHEVTFESIISLKGGPSVFVGTDNELYAIVSNDAAPHDIPKSGEAMMVYQVGYIAKTTPGVIGSKKGGKFGSYTRRKVVHHPGHVGRHFDALIQKKWEPKFKDMMHDAMKTATEKSGHGVK